MRAIRRAVELGLPILGVGLVLAAVLLFARNLFVQLAIVVVGLLLIETGIWNLASPVLPSERRYLALRREVESFILLVRRLNRATLENASEPTAQSRARLLRVRDDMMESVKRMEQSAGQTEEDMNRAGAPGDQPHAAGVGGIAESTGGM